MDISNLKKANLNRFAGALAVGATIGAFAAGAQAATSNTERLQQDWRAAIARTPVPGHGCFTASYPLTLWREVPCVAAPNRPYVPRSGTGGSQTVGNGNDFAAVTKTFTQAAVGSFPKAKHLKSETDFGENNVYSIQLNSNFISGDKACAGAVDPSKCLGWLQYVYSSSERAGFMQYWLIHYAGGSVHCPGGWNSFSDDCYRNSAAVGIPQEPITDLPKISLSGNTVHGGSDTLKFMDGTQAYSTTGADSVMFLADGWHASEFNVIGDGGGSQANFNSGTSLTVRIDLTDGTNAKPVCQAHAGTTGETNNLNLGTCKATKGQSGLLPAVQFVESN